MVGEKTEKVNEISIKKLEEPVDGLQFFVIFWKRKIEFGSIIRI